MDTQSSALRLAAYLLFPIIHLVASLWMVGAREITILNRIFLSKKRALRLSDRRKGAREIRLYQDEVYTTLINFSYYLQKSQEGIKSYDHF